tara:strand:+ start:614 stop:775 length:162 start_codon:yes stop_codon:yes gene_type:complete
MDVKMTKQQSNKDFVNELFDNLFKHVDTDMIDLHDDDSCCDHIQFEQLALDVL